MCGIAGALFWNESADGRPTAAVSAMVAALGHRGPDGHGLSECLSPSARGGRGPAVTLGHTRLAILDLSDRGAQPMRGASGRVWITFNGEIYNFEELRRDLERAGRTFSSRTDTEVIVQGYEEWGEHVLSRLRGMFAFAIWDAGRETLLLARDRLGIKPLYVYRDRRGVAFASEVRTLLSSGLVPRRIDDHALEQYLAYQSVPPPRTLVKDVQLMEPGSVWRIGPTNGETTTRQYWALLDAAAPEAANADIATARVRVHELLVESTRLHLVSDVPVGIFLSGGIDSSALAMLVREVGAVPRTFSVVLPGSRHDEGTYARVVADRVGAEHTEIPLTDVDFLDQLPAALASVDHPSGDGLNTFVVSRAVRATGTKVALSGLGGDEIFGGYPSFGRLRRLASVAPAWRRSSAPLRAMAAAAVRAIGRDSVESTKAAAVLESDGTVAHAFPILRQMFDPEERRRLLGVRGDEPMAVDPYVRLLEQAVSRHPDVELMSFVSYAETRTYMHDVLLRDTDQMSMAHGLEVRVPLLDHRLAEYVVGLPDAVKVASGRPKPLLVDAVGALPTEAVNRPKQGFVLPFGTWMRGALRPFCERHLGTDGLVGRGVCEEGAVQDLWQKFLRGDRSTSWSRPWTLVVLDAWLDACKISR